MNFLNSEQSRTTISSSSADAACGWKLSIEPPYPVESGEASEPFDIGTLRVDGVMLEAEDPPDVLKEGHGWTVLGVSHKKSLY